MDYLFSDKLSKLDLDISKVLLENIDNLENLTITDISILSYSSTSSITKYAKKLGFNGYKELKYKLIIDNNKKIKKINEEDYILEHKLKIDDFFINLNIAKLKELANIIKKSQYICLYGKGPSLGVCKYFSPKIKAISNIPVLVYEDEQMMNLELDNVNNNKTIIFITASLNTDEILKKINRAKTSTNNFFIICEDSNNLNVMSQNNIIKLSNLNIIHNYENMRDRTLFYIYLELLIKTLEQ